MAGLMVLAVFAHMGMAALELPSLWRRDDRRGEFWAVTVLLLIGLGIALPVVGGYQPVSPFRRLESLFKPIGTPLFKGDAR